MRKLALEIFENKENYQAQATKINATKWNQNTHFSFYKNNFMRT